MLKIEQNKVEQVLETVRPYLRADEGDVKLVKINDNGVIELKLLGACADCPLSMMTLRAGIERVLMKEIPEIKRVESIN